MPRSAQVQAAQQALQAQAQIAKEQGGLGGCFKPSKRGMD